MGIEIDEPRWTDADLRKWKVRRRFQLANWAAASRPGSPALRKAIVMAASRIVEFALQSGHEMSAEGLARLKVSNDDVLRLSGPALLTDAIREHLRETTGDSIDAVSGLKAPTQLGSVLVLPVNFFASGQRHSGANDFDDPSACLNHLFSVRARDQSVSLTCIGQLAARAVTPSGL